MNIGRIAAGLLFGLAVANVPARGEEPLSTKDAMVRAQVEAQRKGGADLLERVERAERPGKRGFSPREPGDTVPLPDFKTRSLPAARDAAPPQRQ